MNMRTCFHAQRPMMSLIALCILAAPLGPSRLAAAQPCLNWTYVATDLPTRYSTATAYDADRGVTVLFGGGGPGGNGPSGALVDTWEWDGDRWALRSTSGPAPDEGGLMAYDSVRRVVLLYNSSREMWEWDGAHWTRRATNGPYSAEGPMAFDSARGVAVLMRVSLVTGVGYTTETWEWDGGAWTLRASGGPPARTQAAMAFDSARGVCVLFGGNNAGEWWSFRGDTWEWNGEAWIQRASTGPAPRRHCAFAFDSARGVCVLFAGFNGNYFEDTWEYDAGIWRQVQVPDVPAPNATAMTYDQQRGVITLFSGIYLNGQSSSTWEYDGGAWTRKFTSPPPRLWTAMTHDAARAKTVLFGGFDGVGADFGDTWLLDGSVWSRVDGPGPAARDGHAMAYDSDRAVSVLFGGYPNFGDTWEWNGGAWSLVASAGPSARYLHAMAYDKARGNTVLFGGTTGAGQTWTWNGAAWRLAAVTGPSPRYGPAMAYDEERAVTVLFGGRDFGGRLGDTWEWDGAAWRLRAATGPEPRSDSAMTYNPDRHTIVLAGGDLDSGVTDDSWEWDGSAWSRLCTITGDRSGHAMVHDSTTHSEVLFGGLYTYNSPWYGYSSPLGDTWRLVTANFAIVSGPHDGVAQIGQTVHYRLVAYGPRVAYQWRHNGVAMAGATSLDLNIPINGYADAGEYDCIITANCVSLISATAHLRIIAACPADLNHSGAVNGNDVTILLGSWGGGGGDLNADGITNSADLAILLSSWGECL